MATITETGTIDLKAQKEAHDEASQVATNYITPDGTSTAAFHPEASSANQVKVDGTGIDIIKSGTSVAKYGDVARIGKQSESRIELDYHSMKLIDKDGSTYLHVSDLRDSDGFATITETLIVDENTTVGSTFTRFTLSYVVNSVIRVSIDDVEIASNEYGITTVSPDAVASWLTVLRALNLGQKVTIEYTTTSNLTKAFTLGNRKLTGFVGGLSYAFGSNVIASGRLSIAEGDGTEASGIDSHAEGYQTKASGTISHAEGRETIASGYISHAEGFESVSSGSYSHAEGEETEASGFRCHAEGSHTTASGHQSHAEGGGTEASGMESHAEGSDTTASGSSSHAEGYGTEASGNYSHAQNVKTIARGEAQTAIGKYNIDNTNMDLAFIIGNGTSNNARSDAFTVDWDGNIFTSGNIELKVPTIDRDNPSSSIYDSSHGILLLDKDGEAIGIIRCLQLSDGRIGATIAAYNEKTSGEQVNNSLNVMVDRNGASSYSMTDPAAFRSAISAFSTSGGIITGPVYVKNTVIDRKVNPSSTQYTTDVGGNSAFQLCDKNGAMLGYLRASKQTDGRTGLDLRVWNSDTDGNNVVHGAFQIFIDRSGTVSYSIGNQAGFRNAIGASSGVFPTSVGGTGITSNPSMLTNLGSTSAASVFAASPRPGVTGTLPRANGGTGMSARTTGTVTRSGVTTAGTFNAYSNGVVCTVTGHDLALKTALASGGNVNIGTLPTGYRPPTNMYGTIHAGSSSRNNKGFIRITSDGVVRFSNYSDASWATNYTIAFTITWAL